MRTTICFCFVLLALSCFGAAIPASTSTRVIYASQMGAKLDSDVWAGGGTDDSAALQAGLNLSVNYKSYEFVVDGPALISTNLVINSNTKLRFVTGAGLFLADHKNVWPLGNQQNTNYSTTNIVIEGGIINCNGNSQNEYVTNGFAHSGAPGVWGLWLGGVDNATLRDVTLVSAKTYNYLITDSRNVFMDHCSVYYTNNVSATNTLYGNDGVHLMCNVENVRCSWLRVRNSNDDIFALNTDETDFTLNVQDPRWTTNSGSLSNIVFENIYLDNCKNIGRVQAYGSTNAYLYNFKLLTVYGKGISQGFVTQVSPGVLRAKNWLIDGLDVEMPAAFDTFAQPILDLGAPLLDTLIMNNIRLVDKNGLGMGTVPFVFLGSAITNVQMNNIYLEGSPNNSASGDPAVNVDSAATTNQPDVSIANLTAINWSAVVDSLASGGSGVRNPGQGRVKLVNAQYTPGTPLNGGGFTNFMNGNEPKFISTNWVSGKLYTNISGALQSVVCPVAVTTASVAGGVKVEFVVGSGTVTTATNQAFGVQTVVGTTVTTNTGTLFGYVLPSQMFYFSNSISGAGNSARTLPFGQQVTY